MRYITMVIIALLLLQFYPRRHLKEMLDDHPNLETVYALDTLLSGYWEIRIDDKRTLYPTMIGYRVQPDMDKRDTRPALWSVMERSYYYFKFRIPKRIDGQYDVFYEDAEVRVFVGIK